MKRLLFLLVLALLPVTALAVQISVPSAPGYGYVLIGKTNGNYTPVATSSLGLPSFAYPFPSNATSTNIAFNNGLTASALSIGSLSGAFAGNAGTVYATATGTVSGASVISATAGQSVFGSGLTITTAPGTFGGSGTYVFPAGITLNNNVTAVSSISQDVGDGRGIQPILIATGTSLYIGGNTQPNAGNPGTNNVYLGYKVSTAAVTKDRNTFVGSQTNTSAATTGAFDQTALGFNALARSRGNGNIGIGSVAAANVSNGTFNIGIGAGVDFPSNSGSSQLNIGNVLYGTGLYAATTSSSAPTVGATFGISSSSPFAQLAVHARDGATTQTLFAIGSSTASATTTLFSISNTGSIKTALNCSSNTNGGALTADASGLLSCSDDEGPTFAYPFPSNATSTSIAFNGGLTGVLTGSLVGNANTATALAANGINCTNQAATGVDASGNAEGCFTAATFAYPFPTNATTTVLALSNGASIPKLTNLTSNGFVKTSGADGTLSIDSATYLTGNQTVTLSGVVTGSGATAITTSFGSQSAGVLGNPATGNTAVQATSTLYGAVQNGKVLAGSGGLLAYAATTTNSCSSGITCAYSAGNNAFSIASNALTLGMFPQVSANRLIGNASGATANAAEVATSSLFAGTTGQAAYFSGTGALVGTSSLFISTAGNVGIGTTIPSSFVEVKGNTTSNLVARITNTNSGGLSGLALNSDTITTEQTGFFLKGSTATPYQNLIPNAFVLYTANTAGIGFNVDANGPITFWNNGQETMRISSGPRVGIGTSTPVANLQATTLTANATTTIELGKADQNKGSCMKLYRTDGSAIYAYVAAGATAFTLSTTACATVTGF
jgi:hypothetical protein